MKNFFKSWFYCLLRILVRLIEVIVIPVLFIVSSAVEGIVLVVCLITSPLVYILKGKWLHTMRIVDTVDDWFVDNVTDPVAYLIDSYLYDLSDDN